MIVGDAMRGIFGSARGAGAVVEAMVGGVVAPGGRGPGTISVLAAHVGDALTPAGATLDLFDGIVQRTVRVGLGESFDVGRRTWALDRVVPGSGANSILLRRLS